MTVIQQMPAAKKPECDDQESANEACKWCSGTGLVCGVTPIIDSKNCCADYANAVCPHCQGKGVAAKDE